MSERQTRRAMTSLVVLVGLVVLGCAEKTSAQPTPKTPAIDPALAARLAKLDALLQAQQTQHFPGLVAAVVTRDGVVWSKVYGVRDVTNRIPMTPDVRFRLGSITKVFTSLAILKLRDAGKLELDAPASRWIPELANVVPLTRDSPPITLRHLMTHTSGLPREPQIADPYGMKHEVTEAELLASLRTTHLASATGTVESYSNLGVALEGLVVARVSGRPYAAFMQDELLKPLGMTTATFDRAQIPAGLLASSYTRKGTALEPAVQLREGATAARGQLYMTIADLARLASIELLAWPPRDDADQGPVRRSTLRESQRTEGPSPPSLHTKGAAWFLDATPQGMIAEHGGVGEGFMTDIWLSTSANVAFVIMTNVEDPALMTAAHDARAILLPDVETPLDVAAALLNDSSDTNAARRVDPTYLQGMRSRGSLAAFAKLRANGPCAIAKIDPFDATTGTIQCGALGLHVTATTTATGQLNFLRIERTPASPPPPPPSGPPPAGT